MPRPQRITYHVVEVTDLLRNNAKSYKIYERMPWAALRRQS